MSRYREDNREYGGSQGIGRGRGRYDKDERSPMTESSVGYCSGFKNFDGHRIMDPDQLLIKHLIQITNTISGQGVGEGVYRSSREVL